MQNEREAIVAAKPTMTLNLSQQEMAVIEQLASDADLSKTAIIRQALRLYQLVHERLKAGETMRFSGDREREVLFLGIGLGDHLKGHEHDR